MSDDYIGREAATEFIDDCLLRDEKLQSVEKETLLAVKRRIEAIPTADVRPVVRGEWIYHDDATWKYECPICNSFVPGDWKFCPNCGSYNGGDAE